MLLMAPLTVLPFMTSCTIEDLLNERFVGLFSPNPSTQVTPDVDNLVLVKFVNETEYAVKLTSKIHRPSGIDQEAITLKGTTSVGKLVKNCDTDPPSIIRLKFLGEDNTDDYPSELAFPEVFVVVNGIPTLVSSASPPVYLGQDFTCGSTVMFVVRRIPGEKMKYEAVTYIYEVDPAEVIDIQ
jgi:hypothetical protein